MADQPTHRLAQLSDQHLTAQNTPLAGQIDTEALLRLAFRRLADSGLDFDGVILSGDLTDTGSSEAYQRLQHVIAEQSGLLGCPVLVGAGNHDEGLNFNRTLGPADSVAEIRGLRVIQLDSSVPGAGHGEITHDQLAWLTRQLAGPVRHGTVLVVHHPPVPSASAVMSRFALRNPDDLAEVLVGSDVRIILSGHLHVPGSATLAGIPVAIAGGLSYAADPMYQNRGYRAMTEAQSFTVVELYPGQVVPRVVPVSAHSTLYQIDVG